MEDESSSNLMNLPDDWWRYKSTCQILSDWFSRHLLCLFLSVRIESQTRHGVYTGLLLDHREHLFWVTAGHVIDEIDTILSDSNYSVLRMRWLDGCEIPGAESVVVHNRDLRMFSACKSGIDFGVALIAGLDEANIRNNGRVQIMTKQVWENLHLAQPEGYYILGYPQGWVEVKEYRLPDNRILGSVRANLACLPVSRIECRGSHRTKEFWNDPEAFYGQILPFADGPGYQPENIKGMSGGPLFSIERDLDGEIRYRLFGIQRSWDRDERLVRAEPIHRIIDLMNE